MSLITERHVLDLTVATLGIYNEWSEQDAGTDAIGRHTIRSCVELLGLLADLDVRPRTVKAPATALALRRVELSRDLDRLLTEDPE